MKVIKLLAKLKPCPVMLRRVGETLEEGTYCCELESEGVEGSVINWEYKPLMRRYEIVWVPVVQ